MKYQAVHFSHSCLEVQMGSNYCFALCLGTITSNETTTIS